ncbi:hypothetical protein EV127DRAFT_11090 [Xylaria flabelliformis]|nr:hypothetical protein EV127DRAFT_11090 [Xylaria flabelliformis]
MSTHGDRYLLGGLCLLAWDELVANPGQAYNHDASRCVPPTHTIIPPKAWPFWVGPGKVSVVFRKEPAMAFVDAHFILCATIVVIEIGKKRAPVRQRLRRLPPFHVTYLVPFRPGYQSGHPFYPIQHHTFAISTNNNNFSTTRNKKSTLRNDIYNDRAIPNIEIIRA